MLKTNSVTLHRGIQSLPEAPAPVGPIDWPVTIAVLVESGNNGHPGPAAC
ncbi:hypothetical protein P8631_11965 [Guyparkeria sp. 1SP6A2]|nr:hypothetical protein [Guyparkeria sp. 1SP6A2]